MDFPWLRLFLEIVCCVIRKKKCLLFNGYSHNSVFYCKSRLFIG